TAPGETPQAPARERAGCLQILKSIGRCLPLKPVGPGQTAGPLPCAIRETVRGGLMPCPWLFKSRAL
ncbi:MAG: hypothetical protein PHP07_04885, partial [Eubacteriales bacterium]|nr:hypothetical protein [Eubacteriales bacterium]